MAEVIKDKEKIQATAKKFRLEPQDNKNTSNRNQNACKTTLDNDIIVINHKKI